MREPAELSRAAAIIAVARDLTRSVPPPRGAPYFGLDSEAAYDLSVLDAFCARGIFRKYEFALDLGSGLGGRARWLAARFGCRILGVDPDLSAVSAAALLNRRVRMDDQVAFQVGRFESLPLRPRTFTHVWMVDVPEEMRSARTLREGFRVLRPGAHFALQCRALSPAERDALLGTLAAVGFTNLETRDVECTEPPPPCRVARDRLRFVAPAVRPPAPQPAASRPALHVFASRPA